MRLQKRLSRKIGKKEYVKWVVTIPPDDIQKLGWKEGEELETQIEADKLRLQKSAKKPVSVVLPSKSPNIKRKA